MRNETLSQLLYMYKVNLIIFSLSSKSRQLDSEITKKRRSCPLQ